MSKTYIDARGWVYKVKEAEQYGDVDCTREFKGHVLTTPDSDWIPLDGGYWRPTPGLAQGDLDATAAYYGWTEVMDDE